MGDQVDGIITLCDLEHVGLHHMWKPGKCLIHADADFSSVCGIIQSNGSP